MRKAARGAPPNLTGEKWLAWCKRNDRLLRRFVKQNSAYIQRLINYQRGRYAYMQGDI